MAVNDASASLAAAGKSCRLLQLTPANLKEPIAENPKARGQVLKICG